MFKDFRSNFKNYLRIRHCVAGKEIPIRRSLFVSPPWAADDDSAVDSVGFRTYFPKVQVHEYVRWRVAP